MGIRLCVLGSGSSGNSTYVGTDTTHVLIDAGFSGKETARRLGEIDFDIATLNGVCVSHEHNDHTAGLKVLHNRHKIPLYGNSGTVAAVGRDPKWQEIHWNVFTTGSPFTIGDLTIEPFSVPHDAYEPVGFVISSNGIRVGIATDLGMATHLIRDRLRTCQAIVLESNHDERLLQEAPRPWHLKQRILGRQGHLSNRSAAEILREIAGPTLKMVFLAHLSEDCNREDLALQTSRRILDEEGHHLSYSVIY
ncbi:MAG: MBL fold metallo-hydrolase [Verrucomicrobiota bacterium]